MLMGLPAQITAMQQQSPLQAPMPARDQLVQALLMGGPPPAQQQSTPTGGGGGLPLGLLQSLLSQQGPGAAGNIGAPSAAGNPGVPAVSSVA